MGNYQTQGEAQVEGTELLREFNDYKNGKKRLSKADFSKRIKSDCEKQNRSSSLEEEKLNELSPEKDVVEFKDFLKWKISIGSEKSELPKLLAELFNEVDDGDGFLTPEELMKIEKGVSVVISREEAEEIISTWDSNGDGKMDLGDYIEYKTATSRMSLR
eukprot:GFUD01073087.1.p1 GENE.GFUD01073087.1~~GFUD01073087.1.p1  ORF type:complete len:160 (+),score=55.07 GFUD01073087.1:42-521(+)